MYSGHDVIIVDLEHHSFCFVTGTNLESYVYPSFTQ